MRIEDVFELGEKEEIERVLIEQEDEAVESVVIVDWREEEESIVQYFADATGEDLTAELTDENDLLITYQGKGFSAGLQGDMQDRYRALRTLRDILSEKYEVRIVKESLLSDTHLFVIKDKEWWQEFGKKHSTLATQIFTAFTDDIEFT